ncbi:sensor histidine kinase [Millisia brevis]|uniref:sensor histidine kinase n=1 Tax=Millisia brevis TaxID=264148 RepID=UPI000A078255|nr:ATP-binding protein [Millisia brevis]
MRAGAPHLTAADGRPVVTAAPAGRLSLLGRAAHWSVRVRSTVAATIVVTLGTAIAVSGLLLVLYQTLEGSTRTAAETRVGQLVGELAADGIGRPDPGLLGTDGQIGVVQIVDATGAVRVGSTGAPTTPLTTDVVPFGRTVTIGRVQSREDDGDYWLLGEAVDTPSGPLTVLVGGDREPVEATVRTVGALLAVSGPLIVAFVAWATYLLVGRALRPVEEIRARVDAISTEQLDERVPVPPTGDEIAHLAQTMNQMLARLQAGHAAQRRFISDASHELRSPLSALTAALDMVHTHPDLLGIELVDESLIPETHRMRELVDDLLLLARADEHRLSVGTDSVDLDEILAAEKARLRGHPTLAVRGRIGAVRVTGDTGQISRLVRNLVDNAVRHAHSAVELECERDGDLAVIRVSDDGPGVPADQRERVFTRFVRLDAARSRDAGGSGLGLAIVAEIVAAHHGAVRIDDRPGGGARFTVTLAADTDSYAPAEDLS